jgi:hypothetical protein
VRDPVNDLLIALGSERISFSHHLDDPFLHGDQGFCAFAVSDINTGSISTALLWREHENARLVTS